MFTTATTRCEPIAPKFQNAAAAALALGIPEAVLQGMAERGEVPAISVQAVTGGMVWLLNPDAVLPLINAMAEHAALCRAGASPLQPATAPAGLTPTQLGPPPDRAAHAVDGFAL